MAVQPGIAREIVAGVVRVLEARGFDPSTVAGYAPDLDVVPGEVADAMLDAAAAKLGDPAIGMTIAGSMPLGALGLLDYGLCTSATLREAMSRTATHYHAATERVTLELVEAAPRAGMVFRDRGDGTGRHQWREFAVAVFANRIRQTISADVAFEKVVFAHASHAGADALRTYFGTEVEFGGEADCLAFDAGLLDRPLVTAAASLSALLAAQLEERAPASRVYDPLVERARRALGDGLATKQTDINTVAERLDVSARTLQRALQAAGTTHRRLLAQVRSERARMLLARPGTTMTEVSDQLGFSDPSSFYRAFRQWTKTEEPDADPDDEPQV